MNGRTSTQSSSATYRNDVTSIRLLMDRTSLSFTILVESRSMAPRQSDVKTSSHSMATT